MIYFKSCNRCQGDMLLERDRYGQYLQCIQCGYETDSLQQAQARHATVNVDAVVAKTLSATG